MRSNKHLRICFEHLTGKTILKGLHSIATKLYHATLLRLQLSQVGRQSMNRNKQLRQKENMGDQTNTSGGICFEHLTGISRLHVKKSCTVFAICKETERATLLCRQLSQVGRQSISGDRMLHGVVLALSHFLYTNPDTTV